VPAGAADPALRKVSSVKEQFQEARAIDRILEARGLTIADFTSYRALRRAGKAMILARAASEELTRARTSNILQSIQLHNEIVLKLLSYLKDVLSLKPDPEFSDDYVLLQLIECADACRGKEGMLELASWIKAESLRR
jgi:hypothetical protein